MIRGCFWDEISQSLRNKYVCPVCKTEIVGFTQHELLGGYGEPATTTTINFKENKLTFKDLEETYEKICEKYPKCEYCGKPGERTPKASSQ